MVSDFYKDHQTKSLAAPKTPSIVSFAWGVKEALGRSTVLLFLLESKQEPADKDKLENTPTGLAKVSGGPKHLGKYQ